jgi:hypothetical protein
MLLLLLPSKGLGIAAAKFNDEINGSSVPMDALEGA